MLSVEGRAAYREWRGEEDAAPSDSCRSEDFNSACDAVISSLGNGCYSDWLTVEADVKSQSLLAGEAHASFSSSRNALMLMIDLFGPCSEIYKLLCQWQGGSFAKLAMHLSLHRHSCRHHCHASLQGRTACSRQRCL